MAYHLNAKQRLGLGAAALLIVTAVDKVSIDFGKPSERRLDQMTVAQAEQHLADGQFPAGSMGPKVEAALQFTRATGHPAVIGSVAHLGRMASAKGGTRLVS